ncbi:MAG: 4-alpha-glucanotransferase [Alphaproteobacteria bacterium]
MEHREALTRLADLVGIEPAFWDIFGNKNEATDETRQALLAGMGLSVENDTAIAESFRVQDQRSWRQPLPVVVVLRRGEALRVPLSLTSAMAGQRLRWSLAAEDGAVFSGDVGAAALPVTETRVIDGQTSARVHLTLPDSIPDGYHTLTLAVGRDEWQGKVIVAPSRSYVPDWMDRGDRRWGIACHLYSLRSADNWGIGDFTDLLRLVEVAAEIGASSVGVNPLHSLFPHNPHHASPYSPSSRLFLNPLYLDVTAVPEFAECDKAKKRFATKKFTQRLEAARATPLVDYPAVAGLKSEILEMLYAWFEAKHPAGAKADERRKDFEAFVATGGQPLRRFAIYQALTDVHEGRTWSMWPLTYQSADTPEVEAFAREHEDRVGYHLYLQWEADRQLALVSKRCAETGMAIGLYQDLAVGVDTQGSDVWGNHQAFASARVGAPPDQFNAKGQDWGTPPFNPMRLEETAYADFIAVLRANMRHAGALRIDHVMALQHLYWIPAQGEATAGAYVRYPFDDLLGIVALESHRHKCLVIGEDLGTVPTGFRERMTREAVLSYRVMYFETYPNGLLIRPGAYPKLALATASTHDLPTIAGHWRGNDVGLKVSLGLVSKDQTAEVLAADRIRDRTLLAAALEDQNLIAGDFPQEPNPDDETLRLLILAVHRFLGHSASQFMMANLDDLVVETTQLNLPGTVMEYPNWRRKLSVALESLKDMEYLAESAMAIGDSRSGPPSPP